MPATLSCPHCGSSLSISSEYAGQQGPCPHCHATFSVPPDIADAASDPFAAVPSSVDRDSFDRGECERLALLCLLVGVVLFALADFLAPVLIVVFPPKRALETLLCMLMGAIGAQAGLHAVWCALAPVGGVKRLTAGVGVGLLLAAAWVLGYATSCSAGRFSRSVDWELVMPVLLSLPLLVVAIQSPLWLMRAWCGWRIVHQADDRRASADHRMGIRDLLIATAVVAAALSAARLAVPVSVSSEEEFLLPLAIGALSAMAVSLLTTVPVVAATLRARLVWPALAAALLLHVGIVLGFIIIMSIIEGSPPPRRACVDMACAAFAFFACLAGVLLLMRRLGYRLLWGRPGRPTSRSGQTPSADPWSS